MQWLAIRWQMRTRVKRPDTTLAETLLTRKSVKSENEIVVET